MTDKFQSPNWQETKKRIQADIAFRCEYEQKEVTKTTYFKALINPHVVSVVLFRLQQWLDGGGHTFFGGVLAWLNVWMFGVEIDSRASLAEGVVFLHAGYISIGPNVTVGKRTIFVMQNCIGGFKFFDQQEESAIVIGDDVVFGSGSCVAGGVTIGNRVMIGINASVEKDVADDSMAFGVPARVRSRKKKDEKDEKGGDSA